MGATHFLRHRPDERCRVLATIVPAFIVYALLSLEGPRSHDCPPPSLGLAPLLTPLNAASGVDNVPDTAPATPIPAEHDAPPPVLPPPQLSARAAAPPLPECARDGTQARTFLMVFMGHSGSSAIISELAAHSQVYFEDGEPIDHYEYEHNTTLALEWTRAFFQRGLAVGRTPGFKLRPTHIRNDPQAWAALASEFDTRIIWQYRENVFKKTVGEYTYRYLNDSSVVEGLRRDMPRAERCRIGAGCRFRVDNLQFFHDLLRDSVRSDVGISAAVHLIAGESGCVHPLPYEDYLYARGDAMRGLHDFLGFAHETHKPLRHKATSDNLCDAVANWDELCTSFYGCHAWRWQMDDPRNGCHCSTFSSGPVSYCAVDLP